MKRKIIVISLLIVTLTGCAAVERSKIPPGQNIKRLEYSSNTNTPISIISSTAMVRQGYSGQLSIKGTPDTSYTITATYMLGNLMQTARQAKTTDGSGLVSWSWRVGKSTAPGTYPLIISGGGDTYTTAYTVTK